jgi:predicted DNA-binding transcriptional regulator AlpA
MDLIDLKELLKRLKISRSAMYAKIKAGLWPQAIKIAPRTCRWFSFEVEDMILFMAAAPTDEQIRSKVVSIHAARQKHVAFS